MASFAKYSLIIHQLEESKRLISWDTIPYLRIALILLDNSIELLLTMAIEPELRQDEMQAMIRDLRVRIEKAGGTPHDGDEFAYEPLTEAKKRSISRYFGEKILFLSKDRTIIEPEIGEVIDHLHNYRNSAYHEGFVRRETIFPAVMIQFNIAIDLLMRFGPNSYSSDTPDDWLQERYGLKAGDLFQEKNREVIASSLAEGMSIAEDDLKERLVQHIEGRIEEIIEALDFIHETSSIFSSREEAIKMSQYWKEKADDPIFPDRTGFDEFIPIHDLSDIQDMISKVKSINTADSRISAFKVFSLIEKQLEPIENKVFELAAEIDRIIQLQVDAMRDK